MTSGPFAEGFYAVFFAGRHSEGYGLLVFHGGKITGADPLGVLFDGDYTIDGQGNVFFRVDVTAPANGTLVQGITVGPEGMTYRIEAHLPPNFLDAPYVTIETPPGPVNARFRLLRGMT